jgi:hypothetical protein
MALLGFFQKNSEVKPMWIRIVLGWVEEGGLIDLGPMGFCYKGPTN